MVQTKAKDVTARLTDTSKYTGAHKERFDESGAGKGIIGRENRVNYNGSTSSSSRDHLVTDTKVAKSDKPVVKAKTAAETYGTTARKIILYQYADKNHAGEKIVLTKQKFPSMKQLNEQATKMIPTGKAKLILNKDMKEITSLDDCEDGEKYLVITAFDKKQLDESKIPAAFRA